MHQVRYFPNFSGPMPRGSKRLGSNELVVISSAGEQRCNTWMRGWLILIVGASLRWCGRWSRCGCEHFDRIGGVHNTSKNIINGNMGISDGISQADWGNKRFIRVNIQGKFRRVNFESSSWTSCNPCNRRKNIKRIRKYCPIFP